MRCRTLWEEVLVKDVVVAESVIWWKAKTLMLGVGVKERQMGLASELYVEVETLVVLFLALVQAKGSRI